jgi:membrane associated rhomboid family serine protease
MFRSRGENLRSIYVLLFLNVAFFLLEHQDSEKFARLFSFRWDAVKQGEVWRVFTWQFTQAGDGWVEALSLFITLLLLYMMGSALEEEWGTFRFVMLFIVSTLASAGVAAWLGIPLLNTYFIYFTLLFVYASAFPQQSFYFFGAIPVRVRLLAAFSLAILVYGIVQGGQGNIAAFAGAAVGYVYFLSQRIRVRFVTVEEEQQQISDVPPVRIDTTAIHNAARFAAIKQVLARKNDADIDRLIAQCEREILAGVNICPPADYKPENADGYCIRCEGFAECSARYLKANAPERVSAVPAFSADASASPSAATTHP